MTWLRDAPWLTAERARLYLLAYAVCAIALLAEMAAILAGWRDTPPADADFLSFQAAARLALAGDPALAWDRAAHAAAQTALQGTPGRYFAFFYPPTFLLICLPLGLLPLLPAFVAWVTATGAACLAALRGWFPGAGWPALLAAALSPAAVLNATHGQNAFLSAALLAVAGLSLDRRAGLAGIALASLAFKPQLGLLVIPALVAARRWKVLGAAMLAGLAWVVAAWLAFGLDAWLAFVDRLPAAGQALADGSLAVWKLQSVQAMVRSLGAAWAVAQGLQAIAALAAVAVVVLAARRRPGGMPEVALVAAAAPLATPFVLSYDLVLLLLPTAWVLAEARRDGFRAWEKTGLLAAWLLPGLSIGIGSATGVTIGAVAPAILVALVLRRLRAGWGVAQTARAPPTASVLGGGRRTSAARLGFDAARGSAPRAGGHQHEGARADQHDQRPADDQHDRLLQHCHRRHRHAEHRAHRHDPPGPGMHAGHECAQPEQQQQADLGRVVVHHAAHGWREQQQHRHQEGRPVQGLGAHQAYPPAGGGRTGPAGHDAKKPEDRRQDLPVEQVRLLGSAHPRHAEEAGDQHRHVGRFRQQDAAPGPAGGRRHGRGRRCGGGVVEFARQVQFTCRGRPGAGFGRGASGDRLAHALVSCVGVRWGA
ncbi:glycosyltransferase family 87 protein [Roseomonas fluvialis]|uniref:DUF2029 domain-containing protein n=1 Tax=Roseomonas fluvialis TaxID=1750527 RepID=A0ABN6P7I7_9PROT|nr:glycosyltransferase family 87 protein [Roseomonas fluvialis]BDG73692.1 hypothetical protein Rmf_36210 [Roseomonas fluvialis]